MSGGALEYLCFWTERTDGPDLINVREVERITRPINPEAADRLKDLAESYEVFEAEWEACSDLMRSVEWMLSGDWGVEAVHRSAAKLVTYEANQRRGSAASKEGS